MKSVTCKLVSTTPYSQSRMIDPSEHPKLSKEAPDAYEKRTWHHRMHVSSDGYVEVPLTSFTNAIRESVKRLQIPVPGKKMQMFTKPFEAGFDAIGPMKLAIKAKDVQPERLFVPSDGKPGGGKRVWKLFPKIPSWSGEVTFVIYDDLITQDVFQRAVESAGMLVGIGRFRPQNRGFYGRFTLESMTWNDSADGSFGAAA